ncbi:probable GTPase-activating protein Gyl1p [[Candida] jaroonii]|uniref:Probable GTPase-activating protein Gyl1p n=1 Tax=[Candida] jaroonii TaxID=467808 RepID=A0ACA9Y7C0_9ASCO|nr:probable GTPase-activating protein Gyl1p [[Candida] jaroonii]
MNQDTESDNSEYAEAHSNKSLEVPEVDEEKVEMADSESNYEKSDEKDESNDEKFDEKDVTPIDTSNDTDLPSREPMKDYFRLNEPIIFEPEDLTPSNNHLLVNNLNRIKTTFDNHQDKSSIDQGTSTLKSLFQQIKNASMINTQSSIEWEKWEDLINDKLPIEEINLLINKGIPNEIRGIIWGIISRSNNLKLNDYFYNHANLESIHERQIKKDITRTSFYTSISKLDKINEIFNILKIYSNYDKEIGYTQGMIFVLTPINLQLNEFESFNLLVNIMYDYNLRSFFDNEMKGLHLMLYKFDRLLQLTRPNLFNHLINQGIKSSMYASQWFLTLFSYKFPIDIVYRIFDHFIFEGLDFLLKISINLMILNEHNLMNLKFDKLLGFLQNSLFNIFVNDKYIGDKSPEKSVITDFYSIDKIFKNLININPNDMIKFEAEFNELYRQNKLKEERINKMNLVNGKLRNEIKYLQMNLASLNQDHLSLLQNLINYKIKLPELVSQNFELRENIDQLTEDIDNLKTKINDDVPEDIENQISKLLDINKSETERNISLEDELDELMAQDKELDEKLAPFKKSWFWK